MTTQALLNFNGTSGTTDFTDDTGNQLWTPTPSGNPVLSDVESLYGGTSLYLDGSLSGLESSLANPINGDFTIEGFYWIDIASGSERSLFSFGDLNFTLKLNLSMNYVYFYSPFLGVVMSSYLGRVYSQEWIHIAFVRKGSKVFLFADGIVIGVYDGFTGTITDLYLGIRYFAFNTSYGNSFKGYVEDFRIVDEVVYETNFIVSDLSSELTTSYAKKLIDGEYIDLILLLGDSSLITPFNNEFLFVCGGGTEVAPVDPPPTSTNIISGNVTKLSIPFEVKVVAVSVELEPTVLGYATSDPETGDYSIDVYPWTGNTLVYAVQDYGIQFNPDSGVSTGQIIHPTTPNKNIYVAQNDGNLGGVEPTWPDQGNITSGGVTLTAEPLYRPLMNGFLKPTVTPI